MKHHAQILSACLLMLTALTKSSEGKLSKIDEKEKRRQRARLKRYTARGHNNQLSVPWRGFGVLLIRIFCCRLFRRHRFLCGCSKKCKFISATGC